jgi:hypothetical protein
VDAPAALAAGRADKDAPTTKQAASYLTTYMGYTAEEVRLVQQLFRHKLVHLAEPRSVVRDDQGRLISWEYWHVPHEARRTVVPVGPTELVISLGWSVSYDHRFLLSIPTFVEEIAASADRYLARLATDPELRTKFEQAVETIYSPD